MGDQIMSRRESSPKDNTCTRQHKENTPSKTGSLSVLMSAPENLRPDLELPCQNPPKPPIRKRSVNRIPLGFDTATDIAAISHCSHH